MAIALEMTVHVQRPPKTSLGDFFADMRSWLDHQSIEPAEFRRITAGVFEVRFNSLGDVSLFGRRFASEAALLDAMSAHTKQRPGRRSISQRQADAIPHV